MVTKLLVSAAITLGAILGAAPASADVDFDAATPDELAETGRLVEAAGQRFKAITLDQRQLPVLRDAAAAVTAAFGTTLP